MGRGVFNLVARRSIEMDRDGSQHRVGPHSLEDGHSPGGHDHGIVDVDADQTGLLSGRMQPSRTPLLLTAYAN